MGLFNSVNNCTHRKYVMDRLSEVSDIQNISPDDIENVLKQLKKWQICGCRSYSCCTFNSCIRQADGVIVSILCTSIMKHVYTPIGMLDTTLTPIVKTKTGDVTDKNSYRPIAVATYMSHVMELLILSKTECFLNTSDNQFGFKKKHRTDMCIHAFRQTIEYYKQNSSPVCICYLDATKSFDRVNHWLLFKKLLNRNMPLHIVSLLVCWYRTLHFNVQWGGCSSKCFSAANGVPQGGILSPWLFNILMT